MQSLLLLCRDAGRIARRLHWTLHDQPFPTGLCEVGLLQQLWVQVMSGASMRHQLGFRHTIAWSKPT